MPRYTVTDPATGKKVTLTGDSPPTEQELEEVFASVGGASTAEATIPAPAAPVTAPSNLRNDVTFAGSEGVGRVASAYFPRAAEGAAQGGGYLNQAGRAGLDLLSLPGRIIASAPDMTQPGAAPLEALARKEAPAGSGMVRRITEGVLRDPGTGAAVLAAPVALPVAAGIRGGSLLAQAMRLGAAGALEGAGSAGAHQAENVVEGRGFQPGEAAMEVGANAVLPIPLKGAAMGAKAGLRQMPGAAKWALSQVAGANKDALERAARIGGVADLKAVAGKGADEQVAADLIDTFAHKSDLLPEAQAAEQIIPKLPPVEAVQPITPRTAEAFDTQTGRRLRIEPEVNRLEPIRVDNRPTLKDLDAIDKVDRIDASKGLPTGSEKHAEISKRFRTEAADRSAADFEASQSVKKALKSAGPIYVDDEMRAQLGLSGPRWKEALSEYGLNMFTSDKKAGKSLDRVAMEIGEAQGSGQWENIPRISDQGDLLDAIYSEMGRKARKPDGFQEFVDNAIRTGDHLQDPEVVVAGSLEKGDFVQVSHNIFKVTQKTPDRVELDGTVKVTFMPTDKVYMDKGGRITSAGEEFPEAAVSESMGIPEQAKVRFVKDLRQGHARFRDLLEQKVNETARTPEKEKTLGKLQKLLDLADEQLQGRETLSAREALNFKRDYQDVLAEQYKSRESNEYFQAYKDLARALRVGIEDAAEKSKNPEYIKTMRQLAKKMDAIDRVEKRFLGDDITKAPERAARQIRIINNEPQKSALKELEVLDSLFGTNFAQRAQDVGYAKMLQMSEDGLPLLPIQMTGRALLAVSAGANVYQAKEGQVNPFAMAGLLLSSPRMAVYAFKGLNLGVKASRSEAVRAIKPVLKGAGRTSASRITATSIHDKEEEE